MKKKIIVLFFLLSACEHYSSNIEIVYKNSYTQGYVPEEKKALEKPLISNKTAITPSLKREEIKPLSAYNPKADAPPAPLPKIAKTPALTSSAPTSLKHHIAKPGETYYSISRFYSISPGILMKFNDYEKGGVLKPGDKIKIPPSNITSSESIYKSVKPLTIQASRPKPIVLDEKRKPCLIDFIFPIKQKEQIEKYKERDGVIIKISYEENVRAVADGEIVYVGNDFSNYGNLVIMRHPQSYFSVYGHLKSPQFLHKTKVKKGEIIATTNMVEEKFFFSIRKGKIPIDLAKCISNI